MAKYEGIVFSALQLANWRQFANVELNFHPRLTILTGSNGAGKSTLLNILSRHVGVSRPYLSVPKRDSEGRLSYLTGLFSGAWLNLVGWKPKLKNQVGEIKYSNDTSAQLTVPESVGHSYNIDISNEQQIQGIAITSHRLLPAYQQIPNISFQGIDPDSAFHYFINESNNRYLGNSQTNSSLMFQIKNAIAAWAAIGEGNSVLQANPRQQRAYLGFVEILKKVLPTNLGFIGLSVRPPEVVMVTRSGEFLIDAVSGGVATLIEVAALIYACSIRSDMEGKRFVVTFDEPENHLHPALQRELFLNLTAAFPQVQFIAATHSPFIVSALKDSNVYVLRYRDAEAGSDTQETETWRVVGEKLDYVNRAGTATEILREALGVPSTIPKWVEQDLKSIVHKYETTVLSKAMLEDLRNDLKIAGLSELFPEALVNISRTR